MSEQNPFLKKRNSLPEFPQEFLEVWKYFTALNAEDSSEIGIDLHGLVFEKIYSSMANFWLICCHAMRLTDTTIVLAHMKIDENRVLYKLPTENAWTELNSSDEFVDKLFELIDDPANQRQFYIMQQENDKQFFMGYFHADEPYEIDNRSVKFSVSREQCDILLAQIKKSESSLDWIDASVTPNIYPRTSVSITENVNQYKFITFNGLLFSPCEIKRVNDAAFKFKAKFVRNMRM